MIIEMLEDGEPVETATAIPSADSCEDCGSRHDVWEWALASGMEFAVCLPCLIHDDFARVA